MRHLSVMNLEFGANDYMLCLLESWLYMIMEIMTKECQIISFTCGTHDQWNKLELSGKSLELINHYDSYVWFKVFIWYAY